MIRTTLNLLRRTLVLLGAATGLLAGAPAFSQGTVTLSGASGNSCTYSTMTIAPNGNVSVSCAGGGGNNPPSTPGKAYFTLTAPGSVNPNTTYAGGEFKVTRTESSPPSESVAFGYTVSGTGCNFNSAGPFWLTPAGGAKPSQNLSVATLASGTCTITLTVQEGHQGSSPASVTVGSTPPPNTPITPVGCSPPSEGSFERTNNIGILLRDGGGSSVDQLRMDSGKVAYYKVVGAPKPEQSVLVHFTQGQQPNLPPGMITELSVSKCPGVIETNLPFPCYVRSTFTNSNVVPIFTAAVPVYGWNDQASIGERGCFAPVAQQTYYVNVRWTYASCPWGAGQCGTSMQWAPTGSNF